jgi:hypothetical protein
MGIEVRIRKIIEGDPFKKAYFSVELGEVPPTADLCTSTGLAFFAKTKTAETTALA